MTIVDLLPVDRASASSPPNGWRCSGPEAFALALAPLVDFVAKVLRPVIWLLGVSTNVSVRLFGGDPRAGREEVSDEEIRALVSGSTTSSTRSGRSWTMSSPPASAVCAR